MENSRPLNIIMYGERERENCEEKIKLGIILLMTHIKRETEKEE
jgi:hypothetical protein